MKYFLVVALLISAAGFSQSPYKETYEKQFLKESYPQKLPVLINLYPVYKDSGNFQVYIVVEIAYPFLQFIYKDGEYQAGAELEVSFKDPTSGNNIIHDWKTFLKVDNFSSTRDRGSAHLSIDSLQLPSGRYEVFFKHKDVNGQQHIAFKRRLTLPEVDNFYASPPLLFHPEIPAQTPISGLPFLPSPMIMHWEFNRPMGVFIQFWKKDPMQPVSTHLMVLDNQTGETVYQIDTTFALGEPEGRLSVSIPKTIFQEKKYRLKILHVVNEDSIKKSIPFNVVWFDKPLSLWNPRLRIEPLRYILSEEEYEALTSGNAEEQLQRWEEFWQKRDPTPETPYNELKAEFYSRVDSTLKKFSSRRKAGWRTDPGRIYIIYGPPD
ncbi:MAG: GWxTD domain-containing protein, partial [Methanobacteriota archaeon]